MYYTSFIVYLFSFKRNIIGPIIQDHKCSIHVGLLISRNLLKHVRGIVVACKGIDLRTKFHSYRLEIINDVVLLKVFGAIEAHMLAKVGKPVLGIIFQDRPCIKYEVKLSPVLGHIVLEDVVR